MSRKHGGERYVKSFDGYTHLLMMLYAVISRFDSLREIETAMTAEVRKLHHLGIKTVPRRSTLSDANAIKIQIWVTLIANLTISVLQTVCKGDRVSQDWRQLCVSCSCTTSISRVS